MKTSADVILGQLNPKSTGYSRTTDKINRWRGYTQLWK